MSNIMFLGACNEVTGSKMIVESNNKKVMLDCGMVQGKKDYAYLKNKYFDEDTPRVDNCILSHSHIDHSGMLPSLVKHGFTGNIYSTPATRDLCNHMLKDSVTVFTKELPIISKLLRKKKIKEHVEPLYSIEDVESCMYKFKTVDYDIDTEISDGISFSLHDSCHILGSASMKINLEENGVSSKLWYTSDIGHDRGLLCNTPKTPLDVDYMVIETTYGNKKREEEDITQKIMRNINDAHKRGGRIVIPAFSVGRMQTMILIIHKLYLLGMIPEIPVYVDSPLGLKVTKLYEKYEEQVNEETIAFFRDKGLDPFEWNMIKYIKDMSDSMDVARSDEQCIVISASGMCEGGRVREHIKYVVGDKKSTVLFVGYNAHETLGRRLQECTGQVKIDNANYRVRCKIESVSGLSAHADLDYLVNYVIDVVANNSIKNIYLVHGDPDAVKNVKRVLNEKGITNVVIPELGKKYDL